MKRDIDISMSLTRQRATGLNTAQKFSSAAASAGLLIMALALFNLLPAAGAYTMWASILLLAGGLVGYAVATYRGLPPGIRNNGTWFRSLTSWGATGWIAGMVITAFYVLLYWYPEYLGLATADVSNSGLIALFDPLSFLMKGQPASQWFVYGTLYTLAILLMGVKFLLKYRHNKYQVLRTISVMFFQLAFAFLLPELLEGLQTGKAYFAKDLKNIWPLNYYFFEDWHLRAMLDGGALGMTMLFWGIVLVVVATPVLTYFFGKRWYCSWVCGCGGLAETAGDPFRHLSDKSNEAWQMERIIIHGVLALILLTTGLVLYTWFSGKALDLTIPKLPLYSLLAASALLLYFLQGKYFPGIPRRRTRIWLPVIVLAVIGGFEWRFTNSSTLQFSTYALREWYGFFIGATFSGVIGVGFYPLMGSRVWCRFGCPQAAILGLWQRFFSRFRITTNGGQCISCGNCSTYCEMGIDVRSYAQKGQNIVRASCVGCGICAAVCPRGVLRLENGGEIRKRSAIAAVIITPDEVNILR
jgi:polyferredoxin